MLMQNLFNKMLKEYYFSYHDALKRWPKAAKKRRVRKKWAKRYPNILKLANQAAYMLEYNTRLK